MVLSEIDQRQEAGLFLFSLSFELVWNASIWVDGPCKLRSRQKMHFLSFFDIFELMLDSLTKIKVKLHQCPSHYSILVTQGFIWGIIFFKILMVTLVSSQKSLPSNISAGSVLIRNIHFESQTLTLFDKLPIIVFTRYTGFLWVCWVWALLFLGPRLLVSTKSKYSLPSMARPETKAS